MMTESDNRLFSVIKELDTNLSYVYHNCDVDRAVAHASHTLRWLNQHIDKFALFDFISRFSEDLEYQEEIKSLLNHSLYKAKWKVVY